MFQTCKAVLPAMLEQRRGSIINNASVTALRYGAPSIAYSASKAAVLQITQNIAIQYAAQGIRCNAILPGNIVTHRLVTRLKATFGEGHVERVREWGAQVPTGTAGDPWDVGNAVLFLASDESRYINAIELIIDGGLSASYVGKASA
jgi:NAD(P)-dependent dehydrogenase (short-subunit alcohol dehydrogenase family)